MALIVGGVEQTRGFRRDRWMGPATRASPGPAYPSPTSIRVAGEFASPNGPIWVSTVVRRVENDAGTWQGVTATARVEPTDEADGEAIGSLTENHSFGVLPVGAPAHLRGR